MKKYILSKFDKTLGTYVGECSNKKLAIEVARKYALANKQSILVTKITDNGNKFIGIAEYPYYLRNLELDLSDIKFNKAEPF